MQFFLKIISQKLNSRDGIKKMTANFTWLLADKILKMTVVMAVNIWVWNYLGKDQKGIWDYALVIVTMLSPLASMGIDAIIVRDLILYPDKAPRLMGASFVLKLIGSLALVVIATLFVFIKNPDDFQLLFFVFITASSNVFLAFDSIDLHNQAHLISKYTVLSKSIGYLFTSALKVVFVLIGASLVAFIWMQFVEFGIGAILMIYWYQRKGEKISIWNYDFSTAKALLIQSWPMVITAFLMFVQQNIEQLFIADWIGKGALGVYATASKIIALFGFIPMIIYTTVAPEITKAKALNEGLFRFKLLRVYQIMFIVSASIVAGCFLFGPLVINLLFKAEFSEAGTFMGIMSFRLLFVNYGVAKSLYITNNNLFKYFMVTGIVGVSVNVALNYLWIPIFGAVGAIWASIVSLLISVILIDLLYPKTQVNFWIMIRSMVDVKAYFSKPKFEEE
jgi:O-antigen/teichoic acid export membrane protein